MKCLIVNFFKIIINMLAVIMAYIPSLCAFFKDKFSLCEATDYLSALFLTTRRADPCKLAKETKSPFESNSKYA